MTCTTLHHHGPSEESSPGLLYFRHVGKVGRQRRGRQQWQCPAALRPAVTAPGGEHARYPMRSRSVQGKKDDTLGRSSRVKHDSFGHRL